jgi:hypothetical protein
VDRSGYCSEIASGESAIRVSASQRGPDKRS